MPVLACGLRLSFGEDCADVHLDRVLRHPQRRRNRILIEYARFLGTWVSSVCPPGGGRYPRNKRVQAYPNRSFLSLGPTSARPMPGVAISLAKSS